MSVHIIDELECGETGNDVEFINYDEKSGKFITISGIEYDEDEQTLVGKSFFEDFVENEYDSMYLRDDDIEMDIEITRKYK